MVISSIKVDESLKYSIVIGRILDWAKSPKLKKANKHHPTIKFTAEISPTDATFLDTTIYKGQRFYKE